MRDIKFRAWLYQTDKPQMITMNEMCIRDFSGFDECLKYWSDGVHLMQYTGLKDKNQNDIYEDDWFNISGRIYRVIYQDANFRIVDEKSNKSLSAGCVNLKGVVAGNIYEHQNPELLESK